METQIDEKRRAYYDKRNEQRRTEEFRAQRRATRDLAKNREDCKKYAEKNKEKIAARHKANYIADPEKFKQKRREHYLKNGKQRGLDGIENLTDNYIKSILVLRSEGLKYDDIPQAMIEAKRLQLLIRREVLENTTAEQRSKEAHKRYRLNNPTASRDYYLANKEKCKLAGKAWREKNKEKVAIKQKAWAEANKEKRNEQARARYDPDKQRKKNQAYREAHRDELVNKSRAKYAENKEEINAKRRNITPEQRAHINALARIAVAKRKLKQQGVEQ